MNKLAEHVQANREYWDERAANWVAAGEHSWSASEPYWGIWQLPESQLALLPKDMSGMRTIELGCGTGYVSAWMARRGATPVGIDNSAQQLATARMLMTRHELSFEVVHGDAEHTPFAAESFDFAISEYGAAIWCDPEVWIREAHRLLKPAGRLVFLGDHPLAAVCLNPAGERCEAILHRPYFGLNRLDWREAEYDPGGIEFNRPISAWMSLFAQTGFVVERYQELAAPEDAKGAAFCVDAQWAKDWPSEQVWHLRKSA